MTVRTCLVIAALAACSLPAGCASHTAPLAPPRQLTTEQRNFEAVFLASQDVLIEYGFEIDRRDRRRAEVTARPMVASHLLELWRRDSTSSYDVIENAMQKIYIVVTVKVERMAPSSNQFMPEVVAQRVRSSTPERVPHKARMIATSPGGGEEELRVEGGVPNFVPLGRDRGLEIRLAANISAASILRRARMSQGR